jgi:hypothetical protein
MRGLVRTLLVLVAFVGSLGGTRRAGAGDGAAKDAAAKDRPAFKVRASPGMAFPPVEVLLTAELVKGDDRHPDYYCPEVEWDFADGSRSIQQSDCEPFGAEALLERRFTRRHAFAFPGEYVVTVTLRRAERVVAQAAAKVVIYGGEAATSGPYSASAR